MGNNPATPTALHASALDAFLPKWTMKRIFISQFLNHTKYEISNFSYIIQIYCKMHPDENC
jgi:hypothetical protein